MASQQASERPKKPRADHAVRRQRIRREKAIKMDAGRIHLNVREDDFLAAVIELATLCHWLVYHTYDSRRSQAGFPDLVLVKPDKLIFAELKTTKGAIRPAQRKWLDTLATMAIEQSQVEIYLWRPDDWDGIVKIIAG